ncbi:MAG TPA: hypothetical protein VEK31_11745 [Xanthobacteraceae bacterium]|nr:hypothetical protein [Xanthobacteraceae bacterium]
MLRQFPEPAHRGRILVAVAIVATANAMVATWLGYLSPDSWWYLQLAQAIKSTGAPVVGGRYLAFFPLGYPLILALISLGSTVMVMIVLSKVLNLAFLALIVATLERMGAPLLLAGLVCANVVVLLIASYTWSENLMIVAFFVSLSSVYWRHHGGRNIQLLILCLALVMGSLARYFFGLFLVPMALAYLLAFRSKMRMDVLVCMAVALLAFFSYLAMNHFLAGFATGMPRIPAPEDSLTLLSQFAIANVLCFVCTVVPILFAIWLLQIDPRFDRTAQFVVLCGLAYLGLMAIVRFRFHIENFDWRLLGPGWVMVAAGLALACRAQTEPAAITLGSMTPRGLRLINDAIDRHASRLKAVVRCSKMSLILAFGLFSLVSVHSRDIALAALNRELFESPFASLSDYRKNQANYENFDGIVSLFVPKVRQTISSNYALYYGDVAVLLPSESVTDAPIEKSEFVSRLEWFRAEHPNCQIDFMKISNVDELNEVLRRAFEGRMSPALKQIFVSIFAPNTTVTCSRI